VRGCEERGRGLCLFQDQPFLLKGSQYVLESSGKDSGEPPVIKKTLSARSGMSFEGLNFIRDIFEEFEEESMVAISG